jgi:Protein of unknown function (DUF2637)
MTVLEEKIIRNGHTVKTVPARRHAKPTTPPAAPRLVVVTRWVAVGITAGITGVSFVLSFATLCDLAGRAGYPPHLAWLWPLAVDGTMVQATTAIVVLASHPAQRRNRLFFWSVLAIAAAVSVSGNILHALIPHALPAVLAAAIACVAPLSLLATTHGLAVLSRFQPSR